MRPSKFEARLSYKADPWVRNKHPTQPTKMTRGGLKNWGFRRRWADIVAGTLKEKLKQLRPENGKAQNVK